MRTLPCLSILLITFLSACANDPPLQPAAAVGSDRDPHGCIPSAGYSWCSSTKQCERPWELAQQHAFENTRQAFHKFCENPEK